MTASNVEQATTGRVQDFSLDADTALARLETDGVAGIQNHIVHGDCLDVLPHLPDESVRLVHTSPPYNIDRAYKDVADDKALPEYKAFLRAVADEVYRVLKPNGSFFFQTGYSEADGEDRELFPIDMLTYPDFKEIGFKLWDRIIWRYYGGMAFRRKFRNNHETILWWVRPGRENLSPYFDPDAVRERPKSYDKRNNLWGKNPSNIWAEERVAYGSHRRRTSHVAIYPEAVTERIIRSCSRPEEVVLDPFAGSGTTPAVARSLGRAWIGIEISKSYVEEAVDRAAACQPNEWQTLASGLVKCLCFDNDEGTRDLERCCARFRHWLEQLPLDEYENHLQIELQKVYPDGADGGQNKAAKPGVWEKFDRFFEESDPTHPIILASRILDVSFGQRARWNGLRKFDHTVAQLGMMVDAFEASPSAESFLLSITSCEPSSYSATEDRLRFAGPPLRFASSEEPPVGSELVQEQPDLFTA